MLYSDIPYNSFEKSKKLENKKEEPFSILKNKKSKHKDLTSILFKGFWE